MTYVYILQSINFPEELYVGVTGDLKARLASHNSRQVTHTSKAAPWKIKNYIAFDDQAAAFAFEKYLKSGSGRAFAKRHFR